jgi:ligand-binding sensor domain-containing protein
MVRCLFKRALPVWLALISPTWAPLRVAGGGGPIPAEPRYRVTHWTAESGLPENRVLALAQTPDGYIWIGTLYGLARFDGVRFTVFDHSNTPEMADDAIDELAVDRKDGSLWVGTGNGLLHYRARRFERFGAEHQIGALGQLWAAAGGGVWFPPRSGGAGLAPGRGSARLAGTA